MTNINYLSLKAVTAMHGDEIQQAVSNVVAGGWYLQGSEVAAFEKEYADYCGARHCISCANGLDALTLTLRAYKEMGRLADGDEVIVPANTYIATILAISENNLTPVLIEPKMTNYQIDDTLIEQAVTTRTRAIMLVNLYGFRAYTDRVGEICRKYDLLLIQDCAQSHGMPITQKRETNILTPEEKTLYSSDYEKSSSESGTSDNNSIKNSPLGGWGASTCCWSFYPGKNLGALGDAGAVTTDDEHLATTIRTLANYGSQRKYVFQYQGRNSRLDEVQAAVLRVKLRYLDEDNARRREIAKALIEGISNPLITLPPYDATAVYHIFPILCESRDELQEYLKDNGIGTVIHYPIPPHKQEAYREWNDRSYPITERIHREELSLPCNQTMTAQEVEYIIDKVNGYLPKNI